MQARPAEDARANDDNLPNEAVEEILAEHGGDARAAIPSIARKHLVFGEGA